MNSQPLTNSFELERTELEQRLGVKCTSDLKEYNKIIPLKEIAEINGISLLEKGFVQAMIRAVPLKQDQEVILPYQQANFEIYEAAIEQFRVGQKFVLEDKILNMVTKIRGKFQDFFTSSISKMSPLQVYGKDCQGNNVLAFYLPPIVENHGGISSVLDGTHRCFLNLAAGSTVKVMHLYNISSPLPYNPVTWEEVKLVKERPPIQERYNNLEMSLFRDFGAVGIK